MAEAEAIAQLRRLIAEPDETTYSDVSLSDRLDASTSVFSLAAHIWREKAAGVAELVDTTEGGSSRKMGDLFEQFNAQAGAMREEDAAANPAGRGVIVRRIRR